MFTDDPPDCRSVEDFFASEWQERSYMPPGQVPAIWRDERMLYCLKMPPSGWFVVADASQTLGALNDQRESVFGGVPGAPSELTLSHLLSEDRELTTTIAGWIWARTLDDGSRPHGIMYPSKHGTDLTCAAVWLRRMDDQLDGEEVGEREKRCIGQYDEDLMNAGRLLGVHVH